MILYRVSDLNNGIQIGDIITSYHSGYHLVEDIEERFTTKDNIYMYGGDVGDPLNSLLSYRMICTSTFKPRQSNKILQCDSSYADKVDKAFLEKKIAEQMEIIERIKKLGLLAGIQL